MSLQSEQQNGYTVQNQWIILSAIIQLPLLAILLKVLGYKRTKNFLSRLIPHKHSTSIKNFEQKTQEAHRVSKLVFTASSFGPYKANCLKKALLIWFLLHKRDISTTIRIGIKKDLKGKYLSHAWIEYGGQPLMDSPDTGDIFTVFQSDKL